MERYPMNRPCGRPYQTTCGMSNPQMQHPRMDRRADNADCYMDRKAENSSGCRMNCRTDSNAERRMECQPECKMDCRNGRMAEQTKCERKQECHCHMPGFTPREAEMYAHVDHMTVAMAYVPCQRFTKSFDLCYAFQAGTIFPDLCKPFCGKGGGCRC